MSDLVYSRADMTWLPRAEYERRKADREERAFQRSARQGQLCTPMLIGDGLGLHGVQSMADGKFYDSKSAMRRHYREAGVSEVGNDSSLTSGQRKPAPTHAEREAKRREVQATVGQALAKVDTMSDLTIQARRYEREKSTGKVA